MELHIQRYSKETLRPEIYLYSSIFPTDTNIKHADVVLHWRRAVPHNAVGLPSADPSLCYTARNRIIAWLETERRADSEG